VTGISCTSSVEAAWIYFSIQIVTRSLCWEKSGLSINHHFLFVAVCGSVTGINHLFACKLQASQSDLMEAAARQPVRTRIRSKLAQYPCVATGITIKYRTCCLYTCIKYIYLCQCMVGYSVSWKHAPIHVQELHAHQSFFSREHKKKHIQ
jgi:hypothetical protein